MDVAGTITGTGLDLNGNGDVSGTLGVTGVSTLADDLVVDTDTLIVDVSEEKVGINKAAPATALDVAGTITGTGLDLNGNGDISGVINIGGATTLGSTLEVEETTVLKKAVTIGETDANADLNVNGNIVVKNITLDSFNFGLNSGFTDSDGNIAIPLGIKVDTDTFFIDVANDRVGINKAAPTTALDVAGTITGTGLDLNGNGDISGTLGVTGITTLVDDLWWMPIHY